VLRSVRAPQKRRQYAAANLQAAVRLVQSKTLTVQRASQVKRVPASTLRGWLTKPDAVLGRPTALHRDDEHSLAQYLVECERAFMGYTRQGLFEIAHKLLQARNEYRRKVGEPERHFGTENGLPGGRWLRGFKKRYPILAERRPARLTPAQVRAASPEALSAYIANIGERLAGVEPRQIGNYDEMDAHLTDTGELVFTHRDNREPARGVISDYKSHVTFSSTIFADGAMLPHNVIMAGKTAPDPALAGSNPMSGITISVTGM
jgi:hypothetical protein